MAWTNPTTQSTGTLITATIWNTDIVDNLTALRSGSVALTSQATGDVIYASSSTQLGRVAIGTSGYVLTSNGSAPAWSNTPTLTGTNFTGIPAASILAGTFGSGNYTIPGFLTVSGNYIEVSNSSNTEKAVYVSSNANGTAATAAFRVQNVAYTGYLTLPTATFTTAGLREANVLALVGDAPTLRLGTSHGSGVVQFYSGNTLALTLGASQAASFTGDLSLAATKKLYLDGGGDTYIYESSANTIDVIAGGSGGVRLSSGATSWSAISDERLKTSLTPFDNPVQMLSKLRTGTGSYLAEANTDRRRSFLLAQDVQSVLPEAVDEGVDGMLSLRYVDMIPVLVAAIQQQQAEINALKARIQ